MTGRQSTTQFLPGQMITPVNCCGMHGWRATVVSEQLRLAQLAGTEQSRLQEQKPTRASCSAIGGATRDTRGNGSPRFAIYRGAICAASTPQTCRRWAARGACCAAFQAGRCEAGRWHAGCGTGTGCARQTGRAWRTGCACVCGGGGSHARRPTRANDGRIASGNWRLNFCRRRLIATVRAACTSRPCV